MLQQILDISKMDTNIKQVNEYNAVSVFNAAMQTIEYIQSVRKALENPNQAITDLRILLIKKEQEMHRLQLEADAQMNEIFNREK
ncbi:MAG TPA: hypothetical protein PLS10_08505 [Chitinophagales bacterium]|nr:hypothetical protein [Chitinophagales bacterium]